MQEAATAALQLGKHGGQCVADMVAQFEQRRQYVVAQLRAIEGLTVVEPQGAFYVLPDCSAYIGASAHAEGFGPVPDADSLCTYLLEHVHVACVPGDAFGVPQCIRISYAAAMPVLEEAMIRLASALHPDRFQR